MAVRIPKFHYAWIIAALTFLVLLAAAGARSTPSILMVPLEHEFGWSRSTVSLAASINILLFGMIGPFAASFMQRFGFKKIMLFAFAMTATGVVLSLWMTTPLQYMITWGVFVGTGTGITGLVLGAAVVNRWFYTQRGLVLGALTAANATGQMLFLPAFAYITQKFGWRMTASSLLIVFAVLVPLVLLFMRDHPEEKGLKPFGLAEDLPPATLSNKNPLQQSFAALGEGIRSRDFWMLAGSFFICGASTNGLIGTHLVPACMDHGIPEVQAASLLAVMGIFDLFGTTGSGWLSDRFDSRYLLFAYYGLRGLSLIYLPHGFLQYEAGGLSLFAVFYGLDWIATVPPTVALATKIFGKEKSALMFGWIVASHQVGASAAAYLAGMVRTTNGNYDQAFIFSGSLCVATAVMCLFIGRKQATPVFAASPSN